MNASRNESTQGRMRGEEVKCEQVGLRREEEENLTLEGARGRMATLENTGRGAGDRKKWKQIIIKG